MSRAVPTRVWLATLPVAGAAGLGCTSSLEFLAAAAAEEAAAAAAAEAAAAEAAAAEAAAAEQAALNAATTENALNHLFQAKHGLEPLVGELGSQRAVVEAMLDGLKGRALGSPFQEVVSIAGRDVTVRGAVVNGIIRIATAFIPP